MPNGAAMMAGGGMPQQGQAVQATPGQVQGGGDPQIIKEALKAAVQQSVNQQGYVDMNKLVQAWPSVAQQMGIDIPFTTVLQMVQQDPGLVEDIINQLGLAGIIVNGKMISAEELLQQSQAGKSGAAATGGQQAGQQMPQMPQGV